MAYGYYPRRRFRTVAVKSSKSPRSTKKPNTPRRKNNYKKSQVSFEKKVNQIIAKNIENKYTDTKLTLLDICSKTTTTTTWATWVAGSAATGTFLIPQGTAVNQRVGNGIKLKRWIIKGLIQPNPSFMNVGSSTSLLTNTQVGYVDIYFGRLMNNLTAVPNTLDKMYQNGAVDITPTGAFNEQLFNLNKDLYKVHYHKRFKLGAGNNIPSSNAGFFQTPTAVASQSNDFDLTRSFGFDITKYVLKNKHLKYDELSTTPQQPEMSTLTFWAVFHSAIGTFSNNGGATNQTSFYQIQLMTYAEYEDA